jgi:hypothetical protein
VKSLRPLAVGASRRSYVRLVHHRLGVTVEDCVRHIEFSRERLTKEFEPFERGALRGSGTVEGESLRGPFWRGRGDFRYPRHRRAATGGSAGGNLAAQNETDRSQLAELTLARFSAGNLARKSLMFLTLFSSRNA